MTDRLGPAFLLVILLLPAFVAVQPPPGARAQSETQNEFVNVLPAGYFNATAIAVTAPSIVGYVTKGNVSLDTAFMDGQQVAAFSQTGDVTDSIFHQGGDGNYNALLAAPGTYYLVVYAPSAPANVTELYTVNANIDLRNSTTSVGELITIQPGGLFSIPLHVETLGSSSEVDILGASTEIVQYQVFDNTTGQAVFTSPEVTMTNFTVSPTVSAGYNLTLGRGLYILYIQD